MKQQMRAMMLTRFGGPEVFSCQEISRPTPAANQMLIKVRACGVCGHDLLNRAGHFPKTQLPAVLGHEIAGTVVEIGSDIKRFKVGNRVAVMQRIPCGQCSLCRLNRANICTSGAGFYGEQLSGGYGEFVLASERNAVVVPSSIPLRIACTLSCALGTGLHALRRASLAIGQSVVITGASGGVGIHAVGLAQLLGLHPIAISSSEAKADRLYAAGAKDVVISADMSFHRQVRDITGGEGADGVIEITGKPSFLSSARCLKAGGRMVLVGNVDPGDVPFNPALAVLREIDFLGSSHATLSDLRDVIELVADNKIAPVINEFLPLRQVAMAHELMERRKSVGRVVLTHDE
jgi:acryloyl-coenzyme A reductase